MNHMKRLLFTLLTLLLVGTMQAQEKKLRTIRLKSGIEITGTVINEIPGQEITIQTAGGDTFIYQAYEIDYNGRPDKKEYNNRYNCYRGFVKVGAGIPLNGGLLFIPSVMISNGYQFSPHFYVGLGLGCIGTTYDTYMAVTLNTHSQLTKDRKVSPYVDLNLGYMDNLSDFDFFYGDIEIGAAIFRNAKRAFNMGMGILYMGELPGIQLRLGYAF